MEYGFNINYLEERYGMEKAAEAVARTGFTMLDYTPPLREDNWKEQMKEHIKIFDAAGLKIHQTHAPMNRYRQYEKKLFDACMERSFEAAELMGAKFVAVHGDEYDIENREFSAEAAMDYNHKLFRPYAERAEKCGYKLAFETLFDNDCIPYHRFTSDINELEAMIKSFNSPAVVCCWDFGHARVSFWDDAAKNIERMGSLIQCTHLHDNLGTDSHQMPMTGSMDWDAVMRAFHKIGYDGVLSLEYVYGNMPECLIGDFMKLSLEAAKYLWNM